MQSSGDMIAYDDLPDFSGFATFSQAIEFVASCILRDGMTDIFALDLTNDQIRVPVLYVCAPFAEYDVGTSTCEPGLRVYRFLSAQKQN